MYYQISNQQKSLATLQSASSLTLSQSNSQLLYITNLNWCIVQLPVTRQRLFLHFYCFSGFNEFILCNNQQLIVLCPFIFVFDNFVENGRERFDK